MEAITSAPTLCQPTLAMRRLQLLMLHPAVLVKDPWQGSQNHEDQSCPLGLRAPGTCRPQSQPGSWATPCHPGELQVTVASASMSEWTGPDGTWPCQSPQSHAEGDSGKKQINFLIKVPPKTFVPNTGLSASPHTGAITRTPLWIH